MNSSRIFGLDNSFIWLWIDLFESDFWCPKRVRSTYCISKVATFDNAKDKRFNCKKEKDKNYEKALAFRHKQKAKNKTSFKKSTDFFLSLTQCTVHSAVVVLFFPPILHLMWMWYYVQLDRHTHSKFWRLLNEQWDTWVVLNTAHVQGYWPRQSTRPAQRIGTCIKLMA